MIVVVEVQAAVDAAGTLQTFLFTGGEGWTTRPTDTPANAWVQPRLIQTANFQRSLFSGNRVFGAVQAAYGECKLANLDGGLDAFARYGFDGRKYTIRLGERGALYPAGFTIVLAATMKCALFELSESSGAVRLVLRDRLADLEKPMAPTLYDGAGSSGESAAAAGARKIRTYGTVYGCQPQLLNDTSLLYSVGVPAAGGGCQPGFVTDGLSFLQYDTSYATLAALQAASVASGYWSYCRAAGVFRIGSIPTFEIGAGARESDASGSGTAVSRPGTILRAMAVDAGVAPGDISSTDIVAVDAARAADYGYFVSDDETALSAMSKIAGSASLWFGFDALGTLRVGQFSEPAGSPVFTFSPSNILRLQRLDSTDLAIPIWRVTARSSYNDFPQSSFATGVTIWFRDRFKSNWPKQVQAADATVKAKHPNAGELTVDVYTGNSSGTPADDAGEAARQLALFGVERDLVQITTPITLALLVAIDLGEVTELRYPRFGWAAGKLMRVIGITINLDSMRAEVTLWG